MCSDIDLIGSWSSVLGLLFTVLILIFGYLINSQVKDIQRNIRFHARINNLLKQLDQSKSKYPKYMGEYEDSISKIEYEIRQTEVILGQIKSKVKKTERKSLDSLMGKIKLFKRSLFIHEAQSDKGIWIKIMHWFIKPTVISKKDIWDFYTELSAFQTELENLIKDTKIKYYEGNR